MAISSFNPKTQTYTSTRPPIKLPTSPDLSLTSFIFQSTFSIPHHTALLDSKYSNETLTFLQLKAHLYSKVSQFNVPLVFLQSSSSPNLSSAIPKFSYYSDIIQNYADQHLNSNDVKQTDLAALLYSSGTTGTNKGVMLTHKNFIASTLSFTADQDRYMEGRSVCLCFLPMFHEFGSVLTLAQLRRGNVLVSMAKFGLDKVLVAIAKYKVTHMFVVPPAYGMTEACGKISMENPKEGPPFSGSTGTLMPLIQSKQ
ncbi:hypothetical protein GOBAR_DD34834 [Gossypium barbadense]|nr:hypothetical protein GOBAR_DD34834 [Gossypium barbadense]